MPCCGLGFAFSPGCSATAGEEAGEANRTSEGGGLSPANFVYCVGSFFLDETDGNPGRTRGEPGENPVRTRRDFAAVAAAGVGAGGWPALVWGRSVRFLSLCRAAGFASIASTAVAVGGTVDVATAADASAGNGNKHKRRGCAAD